MSYFCKNEKKWYLNWKVNQQEERKLKVVLANEKLWQKLRKQTIMNYVQVVINAFFDRLPRSSKRCCLIY